jgi:tetratricopeptide (TPR) repeat protein
MVQSELPAVNPADTTQLVSIGDRLMDSGRYEEAVRHYSAALALDPTLVDVHVDRGACYYALDLPHQAISDFSIALESEPNHAIANFNMGIVYGTLGLDSLKAAYWTRFLELDSSDSNLIAVARQYLDERNNRPNGG